MRHAPISHVQADLRSPCFLRPPIHPPTPLNRAGDSRAVLVRTNKILPLTIDHSPTRNDERVRQYSFSFLSSSPLFLFWTAPGRSLFDISNAPPFFMRY